MPLIKTLANQAARIKVFGIGGGGNNAVSRMQGDAESKNVDFIAVNTDSQVLLHSPVQIKLQIGEKLTRGLGSGGDPVVGAKAAEESKDRIKELLEGSDMVFITGGMGGGTCTGSAPVIAKFAKELGILTVAIVTRPFNFEGTKRQATAEDGIRQLKSNVDTLIVIPNQKILEQVNDKTTLVEAFKMADSVLVRGVEAIADLITKPGLINLDFADVKSIMKNGGTALMGVGESEGADRAQSALQEAIRSPLLDVDIQGARGILLNISGGEDITMNEVEQIASTITQSVEAGANIIFGTTIDQTLKGKIKLTVIATGFSDTRPLYKLSKPTPTNVPPPPSGQSTKQEEDDTSTLSSRNADLLAGQTLPEGLEIESDLDIPSFLRKGK